MVNKLTIAIVTAVIMAVESFAFPVNDVHHSHTHPEKEPTVQRFKGLGEMNPTQLHGTTLDPQQRVLKKVSIDDSVDSHHLITQLMGDSVHPRFKSVKGKRSSVI